MTKLNQVLAVEQQIKATASGVVDQTVRQLVHAPADFHGMSRVYQKKHDDGEDFPSESVRVKARVDDTLSTLQAALIGLFDVTATKDWANTKAKADVKIGEQVLLEAVPATYLLWLGNQLDVLEKSVFRKLPILPEDREWGDKPEAGSGLYVTPAVQTVKTQKRHEVVSKAKPTAQHAEQAEIIYTDQTIGHWDTTHRSGAVPLTRIRQLLNRIWLLQQAVKTALQEANMQDVEPQQVGAKIFNWLMEA